MFAWVFVFFMKIKNYKNSLARKNFYLQSGVHQVKAGDVCAINVNIKEQPVDRFLTNCLPSLVGWKLIVLVLFLPGGKSALALFYFTKDLLLTAAEGTQTLWGMAHIIIILLAECSELNMHVFTLLKKKKKRLVESLILTFTTQASSLRWVLYFPFSMLYAWMHSFL